MASATTKGRVCPLSASVIKDWSQSGEIGLGELIRGHSHSIREEGPWGGISHFIFFVLFWLVSLVLEAPWCFSKYKDGDNSSS